MCVSIKWSDDASSKREEIVEEEDRAGDFEGIWIETRVPGGGGDWWIRRNLRIVVRHSAHKIRNMDFCVKPPEIISFEVII